MQRILGLFLGLIVFSGCTLLPATSPVKVNDNMVESNSTGPVSFELAYGESTTVKGIIITFWDVSETPCPIDLDCVDDLRQSFTLEFGGDRMGINTLIFSEPSYNLSHSFGQYQITIDDFTIHNPTASSAREKEYEIFVTVTERDFSNELDDDYDGDSIQLMKPVLYLYPPTPQTVRVQLDFTDPITASYPHYDPEKGSWEVFAYSDGRLINSSDQQEYSYLFWEGVSPDTDFNMDTGFVVAGKDTTAFLQKILPQIGLLPKEYNELIVYWYPLLEKNPYNLIHFSTAEYTQRYPLTITPAPDSTLRLFMVYQPLTTPIEIAPQEFEPFVRHGFTVVEWGGGEVKRP